MNALPKPVETIPADVPAITTPMEMLNRAVVSGASIEVLEKLMALQERWEKNQARKAFNEAFAGFKSEAVKVVRNRSVTDGPLKGRKYAELYSFIEAATPALSQHGLSSSWAITRDEKDWIEVTCIVEHILGGSKQVSLGGPPDAGGAKNALQARISAVTYLERATFKAACGLAEQGDDDDGNAAGGSELIDQEQVEWLQTCIVRAGADIQRFLRYMTGVAKKPIEKLDDIPKRVYPQAIDALNKKHSQDAMERGKQ